MDRDQVVKEIETHTDNVITSVEYIKNKEHEIQQTDGLTVLVLCGGIGTTALSIKNTGRKIKAIIDVEIDPTARAIASANHQIDHVTLPQDLWEVTATDVQDLLDKYSKIDLVMWSTPCQGLSTANRQGKGLNDHRSALFTQAMYILELLRHHNPKIQYVAENVDFRKSHPEDYAWVCERLGVPEYSDAKDLSAANRKRLFWHNLGEADAEHKTEGIDANTLLQRGATLKNGARTAPCLMASWRCTHQRCKGRRASGNHNCTDAHNHTEWHEMYTSNPVMVVQNGVERQITPTEAEALMGYPRGYTRNAEYGERTEIVPDIERLQKLGAGIDVRQLTHLMRRVAETEDGAKVRTSGRERTAEPIGPTQQTVHTQVKPHTGWNTANIARWLTPGPMPGAEKAPPGWAHRWHEGWQMHGVRDLIKCCVRGFPLRYEGDRERHVETENGRTSQDLPEVTADELRKEVKKGRIAGPYAEPPLPGLKVVPRGLKEEPTKFRPISEGNRPFGDSVNDGIPRAEHIHLTRTRDMDRCIQRCMTEHGEVWIAKADVKAAYRTMPVRPEDWQLQGIKWNGEYYIDMRMSFGCRSSVDQWLRFSDAMAWAMERMGEHAPHYVDDFIFIAGSKQKCQEQVDKFDFLCESWGVEKKVQQDCGPAQIITVLGIQYNTIAMTRKIDPGRIQALAELVQEVQGTNHRAEWEKLTGILWYVIRCVPVGTPFLQSIMETTLRARAAGKPAMPSRSAKDALKWWADALAIIAQEDVPWHGESLIKKRRIKVHKAMGDAGSEWGMGGHDDKQYYKAKWTNELWDSVQRKKGPSSLHMEALQLLVMTRILGSAWKGSTVAIELDSLGLKNTVGKGRHRDRKINDILKELFLLQVQHDFVIEPMWVRRCHNEAADALSKDDMDRFWKNVMGNRTQLVITDEHLKAPDGSIRRGQTKTNLQKVRPHTIHKKVGAMRRTQKERADWDTRPQRQITEPIHIKGSGARQQLRKQLTEAVKDHGIMTDPQYATRAGVRHYLKFCERIGEHQDVAPPLEEMTLRLRWWLADAPATYMWKGKMKKGLATGSINVYVGNIDHWWAYKTGNPRRLLTGQYEIIADRKLVAASYRSGQKQVHGLTYEKLGHIMTAADKLPKKTATMLQAAYTMAWFGMLRPTEYMLTPAHDTFDASRHMRAGDVTLCAHGEHIPHDSDAVATHMIINIKQSKTDWQRLGATLTIGATETKHCPVNCMQKYLRMKRLRRDEPLFPGLKYTTMLPMLRKLIGNKAELYGMHSFRVGGAQALAMAGRSFEYIMAKGRWKSVESVIRYVETPLEIRINDSREMMLRRAAPPTQPTNVWGRTHDPEMGKPRYC